MRFLRFAVNGVDLGSVPTASRAIARTTPSRIAANCGSGISNQSLPNEIPNMGVVWEFIVGWWNVPSVGSINSVDYAFATNAVMTFTKPS